MWWLGGWTMKEFVRQMSGNKCATWSTLLILLNTLRPRQNGRHFADDIFKRIFFKENIWISFKISLKFVPKGPINKIPALFLIMAWRRPGDKPLSEAMLVSLLTHICVTGPQWVNEHFQDCSALLLIEKKSWYTYGNQCLACIPSLSLLLLFTGAKKLF